MSEINLGIICDGKTDYRVFAKIAVCLLGDNANQVELKPVRLEQSIVSAIDKYKSEASKIDNGYYLPSPAASNLQDKVLKAIGLAFNEFQVKLGTVCPQDILLITADMEHRLSSKDMYFTTWASSISAIFMGAIERFYDRHVAWGYSRQLLPTVLSLATFPSVEVLVAAARGILNKNYGKTPRELKQLLYGTTHPDDETIEKQALNYITDETVDRIFQNVPEARAFMQLLSLALKG